MKLTLILRLSLILLAMLLILTACTTGENLGFENEDEAISISSSEAPNDADKIEPPLSEYRAGISKSRSELEALFTLQDEEIDIAYDKLEAFEKLALISSDYDAVDALYMEFEDLYFHIETQINIANVIYYMNTTNKSASERYLHFYALFGNLYNAYIESCKRIYNTSPIRDKLFEDWTEKEIEELFAYDPEIQELREINEALLVELNALPDEVFFDRSAEIYADIVTNYNEIAALAGYENYYLYASDRVYGRDYGIDEIEQFASYIQKYYLPNYAVVNSNWQNCYSRLPAEHANIMYDFLFEPFDELNKNYVEGYIHSYAGSMYDGLSHMFANRNAVFASSENSHQSAFQIYFAEYETPFCLFGCYGQSSSSIIHEMGHYYAALYNKDTFSFDLAETQSQANEVLFLAYLKEEMPGSAYAAVRGYTLYNFMVQSIVCVIVDEFEREVYALESVEGYTSEDFDAIMKEVCEKYGGVESLEETVVDINTYWRLTAPNSPVYYISYAVSMTEALNVFSVAEQDVEEARELYRVLIEEVGKSDAFLGAVHKAGLTSPFEEKTFDSVLATLLK